MKRFIFFISLVFFSCGIENPESAMEFAAPLGLDAIVSNNSIHLSFYGFNNEPYFEGYNIYISENDAELKNFSILGRRILPDESYTNKPTIEQIPFSEPKKFIFVVNENFKTTTNNINVLDEILAVDHTYYFTVRGYGNNITSRKYANIVSCSFVTN